MITIFGWAPMTIPGMNQRRQDIQNRVFSMMPS